MDVKLTLDDDEIDAMVVERLEESYNNLLDDLKDREERSDSLAVYNVDREKDIKAIKKMLKHLKKAASYYKPLVLKGTESYDVYTD